jgi:hypothetical protein
VKQSQVFTLFTFVLLAPHLPFLLAWVAAVIFIGMAVRAEWKGK